MLGRAEHMLAFKTADTLPGKGLSIRWVECGFGFGLNVIAGLGILEYSSCVSWIWNGNMDFLL